ncbi:hypothetical protein F5Y17DRAFT_44667 [Xylariaceae sp. FL0594]|nr:hypothetical protein F5Y17DRAFT_44667 [Xylariaceae sp. FL0594]
MTSSVRMYTYFYDHVRKHIGYILADIGSLSPAAQCQLFYVFGAVTVLAIAATPDSVRRLLTEYGARTSSSSNASSSVPTTTPPSDHHDKDSRRQTDSAVTGLLVRLIAPITSASKVPHSWFMHFYILSLSCTVLWAVQFATHGALLETIAESQSSKSTTSMAIEQVGLVWLLMGLQGARRLYEYLVVLQPSSSRMWVVHWLLGNSFYLCTSVAIWVEGSKSLLCSDRRSLPIGSPTVKSVLATSGFMVAWLMQYRCHQHLAGLKKYSLPHEGLFRYLVCPHYTCECLIYLSMAFVAAPEGELYNRTLACAVLFVVVNLGVTANGTKQWYGEKFGVMAQRKWKMVPVLF